jgi:hypothetical protein
MWEVRWDRMEDGPIGPPLPKRDLQPEQLSELGERFGQICGIVGMQVVEAHLRNVCEVPGREMTVS